MAHLESVPATGRAAVTKEREKEKAKKHTRLSTKTPSSFPAKRPRERERETLARRRRRPRPCSRSSVRRRHGGYGDAHSCEEGHAGPGCSAPGAAAAAIALPPPPRGCLSSFAPLLSFPIFVRSIDRSRIGLIHRQLRAISPARSLPGLRICFDSSRALPTRPRLESTIWGKSFNRSFSFLYSIASWPA